MPHSGAGGSDGGTGRFLMGLLMMCIGGYLFLNHIQVTSGMRMGFGHSMYSVSMGGFNYSVTGGMIFVPFIFGVGMIFWNSKNTLGWLLTLGSLAAFSIGIIVSIRMHIKPMSAFDLITVLVLLAGGIGMFGSSLRNFNKQEQSQENNRQ